ncbi:N-acetylmuramoyl-L-alanine amidase [Hyalangium sp.]|uniref:N-acetylmuramoyl-L-alanine amidase n=1 Tax=Hyalangium sp. TaxID=2028555 RepID=UPI002D65CB35|nr:N-acetylmuramoyl-L-alanine amidase [Hyalangium sp.]HYI02328.1 N-acetylmuramoyl-L-alanine amidase [Hyalangium sp.]
MKIINHRLCTDDGTPYPFVESPNHGAKLTAEFLVMHFTAASSAKSAIDWLKNPAAQASAHLVIGRDGNITQLVPFDTVAWHAGKSFWDGRQGLNGFSLGIELDNAGKLTRQGTKWVTWFGKQIPDEEVMEATHKNETTPAGWHTYTEEQIQASLEVSLLLVRTYQLKDFIGHDDVAPGRKTDPGPAFPMANFRGRLMGRAEEQPVVHEVTATLNVRSGPGTSNPTLPGSPLPPGTKVEILSKQGEWRRVDVLHPVNGQMDIQGWVHQRYLKRIG